METTYLYNTLSGKKEPLSGKKINLFVCGPTVYDFAHLGHARTYISFDTFVKYLRSRKIKVFYLQNITDIDDKIIARARETNQTAKELARRFEKEYLEDMKSLKVDGVTKYARATDHIKEIQSQVKRLLEKGFAYETEDGIYYDISKFKGYGKLSKRTVLQAEDAVSRIDETVGKKNKGDFCLWKVSKEGEPAWLSCFGKGRPGWHIEDTAITEKYFGSQYDVHGGARDLIFPHHEAEIAQMEAISGKDPLVKHWMHTGFLTVKGEKMSKSLGNFVTIRNFLDEFGSEGARMLRIFVLKNHYRSPVDYNQTEIEQTGKQLERIDEFVEKLQHPPKTCKNGKLKEALSSFLKGIKEAMEDDFNTPLAIAEIFKLISEGNRLFDQDMVDKKEAKKTLKALEECDSFLEFIFAENKSGKVPADILLLAEEREKWRRDKNWEKADEIRKKMQDLGYSLKDTKYGPKFKKKERG